MPDTVVIDISDVNIATVHSHPARVIKFSLQGTGAVATETPGSVARHRVNDAGDMVNPEDFTPPQVSDKEVAGCADSHTGRTN